ncbi:hypothetical protein MOSE0_F00914 [Monosporozyma servazzii]
MAKKNSKKVKVVESNLKPLLQWNADEDSPFFQIVAHPTEPIIYLGLSDGYLYCYKYDISELKKYKTVKDKDGNDEITVPEVFVGETIAGTEILWKTKRHKGSIRGLSMDSNGEFIISLGNDNIIKKAKSLSGQVVKKVNLPEGWKPSTKMVVTDDAILVGNEDGDVLVMDPTTFHLKNRINKIHFGDAINDIFQFVNKSKHKFISLGQTTLAYWDTHNEDKSKIMLSDDQEDEILCGCFVDNDIDTKGETLICGMGEGVLTVWKPKRNDLEDQLSRIKICKDESIDCIISTLQDDNCVWCGCSNGKLYKANTKSNKIVDIRLHDPEAGDEVTMLDLDHEYRLISGGMDSIRLWPESEEEYLDKDQNGSESDSDSGSDSDSLSDSDDEDDIPVAKEETLTGLSRDELLAELDKDLSGEELSGEELSGEELSDKEESQDKQQQTKPPNAQQNKRKINEKKTPLTKKQRKLQIQQARVGNENHGIVKFDGL